ncbi:MAG: archaellin/type IV pilin N-terminal domain-containing protein [Candidatus Bathyarchaeota archaeon]
MVKLLKDKKAVSPVIATLLMVALAVVAALIVYGWVMGFTTTTVTQTGKALRIEAATLNSTGNKITLYVRNVGTTSLTVDRIYVNNVLAASSLNTAVNPGEVAEIIDESINGVTLTAGTTYVVRVVCVDGTYTEGPYTAT